MNKLVKDKTVSMDKAAMYAGTVTSGVAVEFIQFCSVYKNLPTIDQICLSPDSLAIPGDNNLRWATISMMADKVTEDNFGKLAQYANRMSLDFRILFFRMCLMGSAKLRRHPEFVSAAIELQRYLGPI